MLTRIYFSKKLRIAFDLILGWMREAGMRAHLDAIGNVCGATRATGRACPT
jgi:allantoate deiminase